LYYKIQVAHFIFLQEIAKGTSENDDTLRTLVKMGYKLEEALIAIERLGLFCFHLNVSVGGLLACYSAKNENFVFFIFVACMIHSLSSLDFEHMGLCPLNSVV